MKGILDRLSSSIRYRLEYRAKRYCASRYRERLSLEVGLGTDNDLSLNELTTLRVLLKYRDRVSDLIDVGAHLGRFTHMMAAGFNLDEVVCVEPDTSLHDELLSNTPAQTILVADALSSEEGISQFHVHPDRSMNSLVDVGTEFDELNPYYARDSIEVQSVKTRSLDSLLSLMKPSSARNLMLKVDVQGHEMDVLQSGVEVLKRSSLVVCEYTFWDGYAKNYDLQTLVSWMGDQGFIVKELLDVNYRQASTSCADLLFIPRIGRSNH